MSAGSVFVDSHEVALGHRIGKGGEGEVFVAAGETNLAIKLYTVRDKATREPKIVAMIRAGLAKKSPLTAFPIALVRRKNGDFAGFTMRLVPEHKPLHDLYSPGSRKHNFPQADFRFLVRAAANIARAVASVHHAGCVIGDINHSSILISKKATVALIDADSFQIVDGAQKFRCLVGVPEYTPPELQGLRLSEVVRTSNHDAFGLAIVIFQLIFMGRHPFVGSVRRGEIPPLHEAIRDYRYVYSADHNVGMDQPPGTPSVPRFSPEMAQSFDKAFLRSHSIQRPSAMDWVRTLDGFEKSLVQCVQNDLHYYPGSAPDCPWCVMEERLGSVLFVPFVPAARLVTEPFDPGADGFNLDMVWARISGAADMKAVAEIVPRLNPVSVQPTKEASRSKLSPIFWGRIGAVALAALLVYAAPEAWIVWVPLALFGAFAGRGRTLTKGNAKAFVDRYIELQRRWNAELANWRARCGCKEILELRASLESAKNEYRSLADKERREIAFYNSIRENRQRLNFLDGFLIQNANLKGIGPARLATLASYGVESAAHVTTEKLDGVPGFGPVFISILVTWRAHLESRFVFRQQPTESDIQDLARIRSAIRVKGSELRKRLLAGAQNLGILNARLKTASSLDDPLIIHLHQEIEQAKCDLSALNVPFPDVPLSQSVTSTPTPSAQSSVQPGGHAGNNVTCPKCGSKMVRRVAGRGPNAGKPFWGCSRFPVCRGTRN
jgi:DNA-binding helix-hairpin-helix protein with protein kinase domain